MNREEESRTMIEGAASWCQLRYIRTESRHGDSWRDMTGPELVARLREEIEELETSWQLGDEVEVMSESIDVGTIALILLARTHEEFGVKLGQGLRPESDESGPGGKR